MDQATIQREDAKYSALWQNGYKDAHWKRLAGKVLKKASSCSPPVSLVDFGFGRGTALDFFEEHGLSVQGVDISSYAVRMQKEQGRKVYQASLDHLPMFHDDQFTIGFCNDVLEHLLEEVVVPSLDEMARVCSKYLFLSVCPTPSHHRSLDGEPLHLTVRPLGWWEERFQKYGSVERIPFWFSRSARYVVSLH